MRAALGFGAAALVVGVFAIRQRYDAHNVEAKKTIADLRNREIPQTTSEGEAASDDLAAGYQEMSTWMKSSVMNQIISPPPSLDIISRLPAVESDSGESDSEGSGDSNKSDDEN